MLDQTPTPSDEELIVSGPATDSVEEAPPVQAAKPTNGVPEEIATARKLKNVVAYYLDNGEKDPARIFELCETVRDSVPVLQRATNLKNRIERIVSALSPTG